MIEHDCVRGRHSEHGFRSPHRCHQGIYSSSPACRLIMHKATMPESREVHESSAATLRASVHSL